MQRFLRKKNAPNAKASSSSATHGSFRLRKNKAAHGDTTSLRA